MAAVKKFILSDKKMALIVLLSMIAALCCCAWYLGNQRAVDKYQSTIIALRSENTQLKNDVEDLMEIAYPNGPVSAATAREILLGQYADNDELVTLEYPFSDCARFAEHQKINDWEIPFTEKAFTMKWSGVITAGINIKDVSIKTNKSGEKLIVTIPEAEVFSFEINEESFELLDEQNNIFNPISLQDLLLLDVEVEENMKERAIENTLLETAQDNAMILILDVLRSHPEIGSNYPIQFKLK